MNSMPMLFGATFLAATHFATSSASAPMWPASLSLPVNSLKCS